jgi:signal transduction histidine kinase
MDFTAVAHDLRTPLTVMLGHMRLLAIERLSNTGRHRLEVLEAQVHRMMRLLDTCGEQLGGTPFVAPVVVGALIGELYLRARDSNRTARDRDRLDDRRGSPVRRG